MIDSRDTSDNSILGLLLQCLPQLAGHHAPQSPAYSFLKAVARREVLSAFHEVGEEPRALGPFGNLVFPYEVMGAVDSTNLFDLDELIIFSFYWAHRDRYKTVLDIGANIGLHSIILAKCGFRARAYEPDPYHFELLARNLDLNGCVAVEPINAAVSSRAGRMKFVRVLGNTTSSHLAGSKPNPYGELERIDVDTVSIVDIMKGVDLIKLDAEGHECEILSATSPGHWEHVDAFVEISDERNAHAVFEHMVSLGVNLFAQGLNWQRVLTVEDMPTSYRDGMLFVSRRDDMGWQYPCCREQTE